jgi:hypothetical protein
MHRDLDVEERSPHVPRDESVTMRVPVEAYDIIRAVAQAEHRTMTAQLIILLEAGCEQLGYQVSRTGTDG